jgi:hypothetical protein
MARSVFRSGAGHLQLDQNKFIVKETHHMTTSNNVNINTDEKASKVTIYALIDYIEWYRDKIACENIYIHGIRCDDKFIGNMVLSCLTMPSDFYDGVTEAFDEYWGFVLDELFDDYDEIIGFFEIEECLSLKCQFFEKAPKNPTELNSLAELYRVKLKYYQLSQWFKWSAIECDEVKSKVSLIKSSDNCFDREWAESIVMEYGDEKLHIADFDEFGFEYAHIVVFDEAWRTLNGST